MKGKFCSENGRAREGFFGKKAAEMAPLAGLHGPVAGDPLSPQRVRPSPGAK
jgi:hypothetical protein